MDRNKYSDLIGKRNTPWLRHGEKTLLGIAKAFYSG
jgi:hypothetical protein